MMRLPTIAILLGVLLGAGVVHAQFKAGGEPGQDGNASSPAGTTEGDPAVEGGPPVPWAGKESPAGLWFGLGVSVFAKGGAKAWLRAEAGLPVFEVHDAVTMAILFPLYYTRDKVNVATLPGETLEFKVSQLAFFPGVAFEGTVIEDPGRLSLLGEVGAGPILVVTKTPDQPFMPSGRDTDVRGGVRAGASVRYGFPFGLYFQVQPLGLLVSFGPGGGSGAYEFAFLAGYRLP